MKRTTLILTGTLIGIFMTGGSGEFLAQTPTRTPKIRTDLDVIRGVIKPAVEAVISSEIQARITRLPFKDGQRFKKGQLLVKFDCSKYWAELAAAKADQEAGQKTLDNSVELEKLHSIGHLEIDLTKIDLKKAKAAVQIAQVNVNHCQITAPFPGRVVQTLVNRYESVNPYDKLIRILDDHQFEVELLLPSKALMWLKKNTAFSFTIDETGKTHKAKITQLGAIIDPVSQTIRATGIFTEKPKGMIAGMSGNATFPNQPPSRFSGKPRGPTKGQPIAKKTAKLKEPS